jgi:hypothetical protein
MNEVTLWCVITLISCCIASKPMTCGCYPTVASKIFGYFSM